jgi:hypothetical protein
MLNIPINNYFKHPIFRCNQSATFNICSIVKPVLKK